jgi:hypothetical protein
MNPTNQRELESLPDELLFDVALQLDDPTLLSLCQVSSRFANLCQDEIFWHHRFNQHFPNSAKAANNVMSAHPTRSWRQLYLEVSRSPDLIWRLHFESDFPDFIDAAAAEKQERPHVPHHEREQALGVSSYVSNEDAEFILMDTLSWEDVYNFATNSILLRSPKFIELYQELMEQFRGFAGPIKFLYHPHDESLTSYLPMIIHRIVGPPILPIETYAQINMLLPPKTWKSFRMFRRNLPYYSNAVLIGGVGVRFDIYGIVVGDSFGNITWVPVTRQN